MAACIVWVKRMMAFSRTRSLFLFQGQKFSADLLPDGRIRWSETNQVFNSPSAWAIYCKKLVNPSKKSGCGWASVSLQCFGNNRFCTFKNAS